MKKLREAVEPVMGGQRKAKLDIYTEADRVADAEAHERRWALEVPAADAASPAKAPRKSPLRGPRKAAVPKR